MKYFELKDQLKNLPVFSLQDIFLIDPNFRQPTLYDWEKSGKVIKLRNNCYIFNDYIPHDFDFYLLSNHIYKPSYVSLELALNHYNIIPESVTAITAVSTNKTSSFTTPVGMFIYQSIHPALYFGYKLVEHKNHRIQIASLEKAILDYLYLHPEIHSVDDFAVLRWNRTELNLNLDLEKFSQLLTIFDNKSLTNRVNILRDFLKE